MNPNKIKEQIISYKDKVVLIKIYLGRNKYEEYVGYIDKIYPNLFTFITDNVIKSFSYNDVLTKNVIITVK